METERANKGKDRLTVRTYDLDILTDDNVQHVQGMIYSKSLGVLARRRPQTRIFRQRSPTLAPYHADSEFRIVYDAEDMENGTGWELNRAGPAISRAAEAGGGGLLQAGWAQAVFLAAGLLLCGLGAWMHYSAPSEEEIAAARSAPVHQAPETIRPIEEVLHDDQR